MQCAQFLGMYPGIPYPKKHENRRCLREVNYSLNLLYNGHQHSFYVVALLYVLKKAITVGQTGRNKTSSSYMDV